MTSKELLHPTECTLEGSTAFVVLKDQKGNEFHVLAKDFFLFAPRAMAAHHEAVEGLDFDARAAEMRKCRDEGMTHREIAARFGLSENRVRRWLGRAS